MQNTAAPTPEDLHGALSGAQGSLTDVVAVLWTWLESHLLLLGSLRKKAPELRAEAARRPLERVTAKEIDAIRDAPLLGAALMLARIHEHFVSGLGATLAVPARGIKGEEVHVVWRDPALARHLGPSNDSPPPALEHPALVALAPRLFVSPAMVGGIRLEVLKTVEGMWRRVSDELREGLEEGNLAVHLDTMGDSGLLDPRVELEDASVASGAPVGVGWFEDDTGSPTVEAAISAVEAAVDHACGINPSILLLPELAAAPETLEALSARLASADEAAREDDEPRPPALTIIGLHHAAASATGTLEPGSAAVVGNAALAGHVNEAVVLGPDGEELWRHRKLSSAQARFPMTNAEGLDVDVDIVEDICLGDRLIVAPLPIGAAAVVICLDSFAGHVRDRLTASPANVLFVPSLSPKVIRHRTSLYELVQKLWGIAFVCNRAFGAPDGAETAWNEDEHRSFWAVQRGGPETFRKRGRNAHPSFVVRLDAA